MHYKGSRFKISVVMLFFITTLYCIHFNSCALGKYRSNLLDSKNILFWTPFWNEDDFMIGFGKKPFVNCTYKNCFTTSDRNHIALENFDAVIFHFIYSEEIHGRPWQRSPHQRYILVNSEAPPYSGLDLDTYSSFFNWTMSYRFDSDIVRRHGYIIKKKTNYQIPKPELVKNRTPSTAWFVSHCVTESKREKLTHSLKKYMDIDVYGDCGVLRCPKQPPVFKISTEECYKMLESKYNFYLSFENSYCKDYSTEKLYNILKKNVIPIVYGAGDYKKMTPPHSVINVEDFESANHLADYLKMLVNNPEEYLKYFEWKKQYYIDTTNQEFVCELCKKLHLSQIPKVYDDLKTWWWGPNKKFCRVFP